MHNIITLMYAHVIKNYSVALEALFIFYFLMRYNIYISIYYLYNIINIHINKNNVTHFL